MEKLTEVLAMGGFGLYVWLSFAAAVLIMACMAIASIRALKRANRILSQLQASADHEA